MPEAAFVEPVPCLRGPDECDGMMEPDEDAGCRYWACGSCGFTHGYEQVSEDEGACSLGVPEQFQDRRAPVFIELGRRP